MAHRARITLTTKNGQPLTIFVDAIIHWTQFDPKIKKPTKVERANVEHEETPPEGTDPYCLVQLHMPGYATQTAKFVRESHDEILRRVDQAEHSAENAYITRARNEAHARRLGSSA